MTPNRKCKALLPTFLSPVFWSQGCLSAEDPDQLVMVEIEFSTTIDDCVIVVVSVQNPIVLLWEQGDWLKKKTTKAV